MEKVKKMRWEIVLGIILILASAVLYYFHYAVFRDAHHIFIYLVGDVAFLPIEVLIVSLIIHRILSAREKKAVMSKLNMVIGVFFSEVGNDLMKKIASFEKNGNKERECLMVQPDWTGRDFDKAKKQVQHYDFEIDGRRGDLGDLKNFLEQRRNFLLRLLENPVLLEHRSFTNLLWAVFHLTEEMVNRYTLIDLPQSDYCHLAGDIARVSRQLFAQWLDYMKHLKKDYPYLFSLAIRMNPFDPHQCVTVKQ